MVHPGELISRTGEALVAGRFDVMAKNHAYPFVVAVNDVHHVITDSEDLTNVLTVFHNDLMRQQIVSAKTHLESHIVFNDDLAFLNAQIVYFDRNGTEVTDSRCSFVMRRSEQRWEIVTISIDKMATHAPGACLLEARAA